MSLSHELVSQFAKLVTKDKKTDSESTVYGTIIVDGSGNKYVKLDGSDQLTPLSDDERPVADSSTVNANEGERVSVLIKNHTATVTGNVSSPAARTGDVEQLGSDIQKIQEFDILIGSQIQAQEGYIQKLQSDKADIGELRAAEATITELVSKKASIEELDAVKATIEDLDATKIDAGIVNAEFVTINGKLEATTAEIDDLLVDYGSFKEVSTGKFTAIDAEIERLDAKEISTEELDARYANIDFANIDEAAITKLFTDSGIIKELVASDGKITHELVGVTIRGDLITAGTLTADKLVVKGSDGIYYALNIDALGVTSDDLSEEEQEELQNGLHGSAIIAKTVTAEKIAVDDLVAFDATIGGFVISGGDSENGIPASIHSFAKSSADNTVEGVYLGSDGQMAVGDGTRFLRYFKDADGNYKLEIAADSLKFSTINKTVEEVIEDTNSRIDNIRVGARNLIRNSTDLVYENYYFFDENAFVLGVSQLGAFALTRDTESEPEAVTYNLEGEETELTEVVELNETTDQYNHQGFKDGMTLHDYHLINMENAIIAALGGVPVSRITTVSLPASGWSGSGTIYSQAVTMSGVTARSKIDLLPSPEQLNDLLIAEISLTAANSDGSITVFAIGSAPSMDLELQAMITEVIVPEVNA